MLGFPAMTITFVSGIVWLLSLNENVPAVGFSDGNDSAAYQVGGRVAKQAYSQAGHCGVLNTRIFCRFRVY